MDFELSEQQAAFRDLMRDFARKSIAPVARDWELAGRYPEEIVDDMKAMGLFGMLVPEEFGGIAIDAVSYSVVFEEISKAWMGVAGILGSHSLATLMLARSGTPEQRERWLPDLATGKAFGPPGSGRHSTPVCQWGMAFDGFVSVFLIGSSLSAVFFCPKQTDFPPGCSAGADRRPG